jgi:hypothetical protein
MMLRPLQVSCDGDKNPSVTNGGLAVQQFGDMYASVSTLSLAYYFSMRLAFQHHDEHYGCKIDRPQVNGNTILDFELDTLICF